jgi:hypothetical protein
LKCYASKMDPKYEETNKIAPGTSLPMGTDAAYDNRKGKYNRESVKQDPNNM